MFQLPMISYLTECIHAEKEPAAVEIIVTHCLVDNFYGIGVNVNVNRSKLPKNVRFMMTSSNGNGFRVTGPLSPVNSPLKGQWRVPLMMFSLVCALNKRLSTQSWCWWFETPLRSLWRHCNGKDLLNSIPNRLLHIQASSLMDKYRSKR